jgi:hypothetical protein
MIDGGEADDEIIGVLENDYVWGGARNVSDVPSVLVERLQHYVVGDFYTLEVEGPFYAIVSSLALHHLATDDDKLWFFRRIYNFAVYGGIKRTRE